MLRRVCSCRCVGDMSEICVRCLGGGMTCKFDGQLASALSVVASLPNAIMFIQLNVLRANLKPLLAPSTSVLLLHNDMTYRSSFRGLKERGTI